MARISVPYNKEAIAHVQESHRRMNDESRQNLSHCACHAILHELNMIHVYVNVHLVP
jgi:hypothetical protein